MSRIRPAPMSLVLLLALGRAPAVVAVPGAGAAAAVDGARIIHADRHPGEWLTYGRTYSEQRFSPLAQINDRDVGRLGLAWYYDIGGTGACKSPHRWSLAASCISPPPGAG